MFASECYFWYCPLQCPVAGSVWSELWPRLSHDTWLNQYPIITVSVTSPSPPQVSDISLPIGQPALRQRCYWSTLGCTSALSHHLYILYQNLTTSITFAPSFRRAFKKENYSWRESQHKSFQKCLKWHQNGFETWDPRFLPEKNTRIDLRYF